MPRRYGQTRRTGQRGRWTCGNHLPRSRAAAHGALVREGVPLNVVSKSPRPLQLSQYLPLPRPHRTCRDDRHGPLPHLVRRPGAGRAVTAAWCDRHVMTDVAVTGEWLHGQPGSFRTGRGTVVARKSHRGQMSAPEESVPKPCAAYWSPGSTIDLHEHARLLPKARGHGVDGKMSEAVRHYLRQLAHT